jgi:DNA topoisomerase I
MDTQTLIEKLPKSKIRKIINDPVKTAEAINLVYVTDEKPGIERKKKGDEFRFYYQGEEIKDEEVIKRIRSLVLPPAWENVWICKMDNGHLQATGVDVKKRKQYKYHPGWNTLRNQTKFFRLLDFGKALPAIRLRLEQDLSKTGLSQEKVLAAVVMLMERTNIRIGNSVYEKLYGSFGLTTLKDKHVEITGTKMKFAFKGKKGVAHDISLKNKKLASIVAKCKDIPGKELFQYYDEAGKAQAIDSGMVNEYIKNISGADFTAKDFRTWAGTINAFLAFKEIGFAETVTAVKKNIVEALDKVAAQLGNTRTVCKKYYVHPAIISMYESKSLEKYFKELEEIAVDDQKADLTSDEKIIMKILASS